MEVYKKEECYGCSACIHVCPVQAVDMQLDNNGFFYPEIDENKCVHCGACKGVCPLQNQKVTENNVLLEAHAVKNRDESVRNNSSSGGAFYALARCVLQKGGIVYGAVFDDEFRIVHVRGTNTEDIRRMQRAKYVQSDLKNIFELVKRDLLNDKDVLFTGCPCQVDGLKHYLRGCKQEKLISCDLICHGVNSPRVWMDYLSFIKKKDEILNINFRNKSKGWRRSYMHIHMNHKDYIEDANYDSFFQVFFSGVGLRPSCFLCKYANLNRVGDITLGDFWGIEHVDPEMDDNKGVSLVLLNSYKGKELFSKVISDFEEKSIGIEKCMQPSLKSSREKPEQYENFWMDYNSRADFSFIRKKYLNGGLKGKIKRVVKMILIKMKLWE